jgi:hypothetical protein
MSRGSARVFVAFREFLAPRDRSLRRNTTPISHQFFHRERHAPPTSTMMRRGLWQQVCHETTLDHLLRFRD